MARLRILYIGPHPPSAIAVRPWLFLGALRERHAIDILTPYRPTSLDRLAALRHLPDRAYPLQTMAVESLRMRQAVRRAIARTRYDVIHVEHVRAFPFVPLAERHRVLFDAVDCVSDLFAQAAPYQGRARGRIFRQEAGRLARFEAQAIASVARVLVASRRDAAGMRALWPPAPVSVLHNPVDLDRFRPGLRRSPNTVVFTGKMSFHANRVAAEWLCDEIWPRVRARHPEARLLLAGARPPRSLLRRRAADVSVTGYVPDLRALIAG